MVARRADRPERSDVPSGCRGPVSCACRQAVVRAFHEMILLGASREEAIHVAARIYTYYHPEAADPNIGSVIERLVAPQALN